MKVLKDNKGNSIVEATIVFPIIIMITLVLFYLSLFLCQRAILQSNLQTALLYYKNAETDTYVTNDINGATSVLNMHVSRYNEPTLQDPYRTLFMTTKKQDGDFKSLFATIAGKMFFSSVSKQSVTYETKNYIVYKSITATVTQEVKMPVRFEILGFDPSVTLGVEARIVINDPDEFVRNSQLVGNLVADTKVGEVFSNATGKVAEAYSKIKEVLHINRENNTQ